MNKTNLIHFYITYLNLIYSDLRVEWLKFNFRNHNYARENFIIVIHLQHGITSGHVGEHNSQHDEFKYLVVKIDARGERVGRVKTSLHYSDEPLTFTSTARAVVVVIAALHRGVTLS